ncbi:hypothetical protein Slala02_27670 [Streptomyces lavendulae subsp. lavendulae]|nr:hypothetical protein Slala01_30970 [Streptomyces lavendulae subsp. lavendulae]GLX26947.1 hypothetical protein Slala02_27670 [Streptomyces lavendulae subsp. lavendulae]
MSEASNAPSDPEQDGEPTLPRHVTWPHGVEYPAQLELRDKQGQILAYYDLRHEDDEPSARWQMRSRGGVGSAPT